MSVTRYDVNGPSSVFEDVNGSLVDYKDYAALEAKCAALAAENAGLKNALEWLYEAVSMPDSGPIPDKYYSAVTNAAAVMHETPATDAFLAEVRAQVWIEGSEPEEFGRYWVRYETDVGPQYCSAKWMEHNFCAGSDTNIHKIWLADHSRSINSLRGVTHYTKLPDSLEGAAQ